MEYAAAGRPAEASHIAGACVQAHVDQGWVIEVSWVATAEVGKRERLGLEVDLIAAYRRVMGESPTCQFAGMALTLPVKAEPVLEVMGRVPGSGGHP
jgi:hypothetical protein